MVNLPVTLFHSIASGSTGPNGKTLTYPYYSEKTPGCGYFGQTDPMHTIQYSTTALFTGLINIQGTLALDPKETDWYIIQGAGLGNGVSPVFDQTLLCNFGGNHVWIRAVIQSFASGSLNRLQLQHN